jgi:hypothetical protein
VCSSDLFFIALSVVAETAKDNEAMATRSLHTSVFISKAEALDLLESRLGLAWVTDDPSDVTLPLDQGVWLSIEVPHYGEDLPLTLDGHHDDAQVLNQVMSEFAVTLKDTLGWDSQLL